MEQVEDQWQVEANVTLFSNNIQAYIRIVSRYSIQNTLDDRKIDQYQIKANKILFKQ